MADSAYAEAVDKALTSAKSMLGKNEVPDQEDIKSYLHDGGQDLDPHTAAWCAAFVSSSLQRAGLPVPTQVIKGSSYGPGAWAPNYLTYGSAVEPAGIQAGDVLVSKTGHHVGFAEGPIRQGPNGPEVRLLAGNEADTSGRYEPGTHRSQVGMVGERWVPLSEYQARRAETPPEGSMTLTSSPATSSSVLDRMRENIGKYESGNDYNILGKRTNLGDQAVGRYQVMKSNIPSWTKRWLGREMTPEEFRANPKAQDAVFNGEFGSYLTQYSPADASSKWFTGGPLSTGADKKDILGTSGARYVTSTIGGIDNPYAFNGATATTAPAAAAAPPPPTFGESIAKGDVGGALRAALTKPPAKDGVEQKSPLEKVGDAIGGQGQQKQAPAIPEQQPMIAVQDPDPGLAPAAQQLFSTVQAAAAKPLTWTSTPYGSTAGLQRPLGPMGTTLNATGYGYNG